MTDDLDDLKQALHAATPEPDAERRAENIALAMKNFDALQGNADDARLTSDRPKTGPFRGALKMLTKTLSQRGVLTATTALAAVALMALVPVLRDTHLPGAPAVITLESEAVPADAQPPQPAIVQDAPSRATRAPAGAKDAPSRAKIAPAPAPARAPRMMTRDAPQGMGGLSRSFEAPPLLLEAPQAQDRAFAPAQDSEAFPQAEANPIKITVQEPVSTFSIDVDTASWSIIRNSLNRGQLPPQGAVRIEEMVNYFTYDYPAPDGKAPFRTSIGVSDSPWRAGTQIVHIGLQGAQPAERPNMNLVFLIDTSGSMNSPAKLPLLKQSFRLMLGQLSPEDTVSIVTYAGSAGRVLDPTPASDRAAIFAALDALNAGGGTAGQAGLQQAYATAREMTEEGEVSRVILATDGDFNLGISDPEALKDYIAKERDSGTYLSVLGFGRGNLDDATMQALAQTGNGMAAYIDTLAEAQKVLVDQLTGALVPIADDVKIQVEFNPATVAEYRLIGYETRALRREDFNNDKVDAGEIGAGHQVTALYEITPVESDARLTDPLRYGTDAQPAQSDELGFLRLRYKAPGSDESQLIEAPIKPGTAPLPDAQFAQAIAGFGQLLQGSDLLGDFTYDQAIALAQGARGADPYGYRQEAITLMRLAQSLSR